MNQFKESIEWYDKALQIDLKYKDGLFGKGESLRMLLQYNQALQFLDSALQIDNNYDDALASKGACLIHMNKLNEAEICLNTAIKLNIFKKCFYYQFQQQNQTTQLQHNYNLLINKVFDVDIHFNNRIIEQDISRNLQSFYDKFKKQLIIQIISLVV